MTLNEGIKMKKNVLFLMFIIVGNAFSADEITLECNYEMLCRGSSCRTPAYVKDLYTIDLDNRTIDRGGASNKAKITSLTDQYITYEYSYITGRINRFNGDMTESKGDIVYGEGNCKKVNARF